MEEMFEVLDSNGVFTGEVASRAVCHAQGLWHRAVVVFLLNSKNQVLLQKRSLTKRIWPGQWDVSSGGHVLAGELGFEAALRECREELGVSLQPTDLTFIGGCISAERQGDIFNQHFNDFFVARKDLALSDFTLQPEEVSEVKWVDEDDIVRDIKEGYRGITDKTGCWDYLVKYYEWQKSAKLSANENYVL